MNKHLAVGFGLLLGLSAMAQATFYATNLPSQVGQYNLSYFSSNNAYIASMLTLATNPPNGPFPPEPGVPQVWNFSAVQQPSETVLRTDIIAPASGTDGGYFPLATYAERDTLAPSSQIAWRYYSITNQGRYYYGFYEPQSVNASGLALFTAPTLDLPAIIKYGDTWSRTVTWNQTVLTVDEINYVFTTTATVDAFGTLTLPAIGTVAALRVHEAQDYQASLDGTLVEDAPCQYYYWLVPGLGVAVQIIQNGTDTAGKLTGDNFVERMYYANYFTNPLPSSIPPIQCNLFIRVTNQTVLLNWAAFTNSTSYQVEARGLLNSTNWQSLGLTTSTNWSDTLTSTQRYYRVVGTN